MLRDTGLRRATSSRYLDSTFSALSKGSCVPSYRQLWMASGAGRLPAVAACVMVLPTTKPGATRGSAGPPPGMRKPFTSQGCTARAPSLINQRLALASNSSGATTSSTRPAFSACSAVALLPSISQGMAAMRPSMRGRRCVPPPPGSRPTCTSGRPTTTPGALDITRRWQPRHSS